MINIPPIKQSSPVKAEVIADVTRAWKVGQVLNATTQRGGEALSNVLIRVGQHTIEAKTPVPLQDGQDIKLLVKSLAENQANNQISRLPLLSIIETPAETPQTSQLAAIKLRQFIAIQQSFSQVQHLANELLSHKNASEKLSAPLKNLLNTLQHALQLNIRGISPAQLKQQILNSGIFYESKLLTSNLLQQTAQQKTESRFEDRLINDFKFQLLSIKSELAQFFQVKPQSVVQIPAAQQMEQLQIFIKQSGSNLTATHINQLTDKLVELLPKTTLIQLGNLLNGQKADASISNEIQSLAKLITFTLQQHGSQKSQQQLQEQLHFRLMLLDLNQQIDQSISKVTSLQLQPMSREGDNLVLLLFNLVFKDSHERFDIDFHIQQENNKTESNDESWSVTLGFNFQILGKVQSKIHLVGDQVSSVFHTELSSTADKIDKLLPLLQIGLTKAGLNIINLSVDNKLSEIRPFFSNKINLLDENA